MKVDKFIKDALRYYGLEMIYKEGTIKQALKNLLEERPNLKACLLGTRKGDPGTKELKSFSPTDPDWPTIMRVNPIINWTYTQVNILIIN